MQLTLPQTSPVFTVLLLEPFLEPQMYTNSVFLIVLLVSFLELIADGENMFDGMLTSSSLCQIEKDEK